MTLASSSPLAKALATLNTLVRSGVEYPDAHWKASSTHKVDADALQALYDGQSNAGDASRAAYEARVQGYENEGMCRSDAQAVADADILCGRLVLNP